MSPVSGRFGLFLMIFHDFWLFFSVLGLFIDDSGSKIDAHGPKNGNRRRTEGFESPTVCTSLGEGLVSDHDIFEPSGNFARADGCAGENRRDVALHR